MPGIQKLHLEDALEDSPQTRSLVDVFEKDAMVLRSFTQGLNQCCRRVLNAQRELSAATHSLSSHLKAYEKTQFPLETDDTILTATLKQFSVYLDELSSVHQILATQLGDGMMYPLGKFLQADLDEVANMSEMYKFAGEEHEQSLIRYMKLPKKKDQKTKRETNEDLYVYRKKYHQTSMHYYSALNALQYKRRASLLEPLVGYVYSQRAFFEMGKDATAKMEIEQFLSNINASVQAVRHELNDETRKTVEVIESIERQSLHKYYAEPHPDMPFIPPNPTLTQKAGYLFLRSKQALITTKWEKCYFFIQGGNLMCQSKDEVAGSLILDLNQSGTHAEPCEADDRRFVFHIIAPIAKKTVILQAENDRERDEWISTITNVVKESGYIRGAPRAVDPQQEAKTTQELDLGAISGDVISDVKEMIREQAGTKPNSPPAPLHSPDFMPDVPIQFDIISPGDETKTFLGNGKAGPPKRLNPFDQSATDISVANNAPDNAAFSQTFVVRFLGSMEVKGDRGEQLIHEAIRQIMAARAIHNIFKTTESHLLVSSQVMRLLDPSNSTIRTEFQLEDISFWAAHNENKRLFAFITRTRAAGTSTQPTFACHAFECNTSGDEICLAISTATKLAFQALMDHSTKQRVKQEEQAILLANIQQLDDVLDEEADDPPDPAEMAAIAADEMQLSDNGKYLLLGDQAEASPPQSTDHVAPSIPEQQAVSEPTAKVEAAQEPAEDSESEA